jgi:hypothetical protein
MQCPIPSIESRFPGFIGENGRCVRLVEAERIKDEDGAYEDASDLC